MKTKTILERFYDYRDENPQVYALFKRYTFQAITNGRKRFAVGAIWERLRWEIAFGTNDQDSDFKLNDHFRAYYARLFAFDHPQHRTFFECRSLRAVGSEMLDQHPALISRGSTP